MIAPSSRLRFQRVSDLYGAFPTAKVDVGRDGDDTPSMAFVQKAMAAGETTAAFSYLAYLLGRREAVWWGCLCLRQVSPLFPSEIVSLDAAEGWVRAPDETSRRRALGHGLESNTRYAGTWLALAAGWSGGNMADDDSIRIPPAPQMTAQGVRAAVVMAGARLPADRQTRILLEWSEAGLRYALNPQS